MANNNYTGFSYGGTQYNSAGGAGYNAGQVSYPAVTNATYANAAAYQTAAVAAGHGGYAAGAGGYGGYSDYSRAFYQQQPPASGGYGAPPSAATVSKTHYSAPPVKNLNAGPKGVGGGAGGAGGGGGGKDKAGAAAVAKQQQQAGAAAAAGTSAAAATASAAGAYSNYDVALYSAASMYAAHQHQQQHGGGGGGGPGGHGVPNMAAGGGPMGGPAGGGGLGLNKANGGGGNNWSQYRQNKAGPGAMGRGGARPKNPPRPQQLHYCEVCKISCAGPQTYREHLEGQKHKKREASLKMQASAQSAVQNRGNNYHCELCDVTCTGTDAYAAHVRGSKHQKVVKLHQKLGKPIPSDEPKKMYKINFVPTSGGAAGSAAAGAAKENEQPMDGQAIAGDVDLNDDNADDVSASGGENSDNIKPVGGEYIDEIKDDEGKILSFNCKLCDCKFNDPNAKEMHMKGRRHRLQYKRKVQPDLVVDFKPTPRQRRLAEARAQRALMQSHRGQNVPFGEEHDGGPNMYWDEQRRRSQYDDEYDYSNWLARSFAGSQRGFAGRMGNNGPPPFYGMMPGGANVRRPESTDDRHAIARHAEIYPKEEELQTIQRIVSHTERALKFVSDALTDNRDDAAAAGKKDKSDTSADKDGRDNQMLSFQKEADTGNLRVLKGVMRVGYLAKGLLLQGDKSVELVVLCSEKPTVGLLKRVAAELPAKLKEVAGDNPIEYTVEVQIEESAVIVSDQVVSVKISLTSPLLRESIVGGTGASAAADKVAEDTANAAGVDASMNEKTPEIAAAAAPEANNDEATVLPREPCLRALAELRHAKWFQARATGLQSCVMVIRILRDLCQRTQSWQSLPQWPLELLVEKVISSAGYPISPGDCLRRIMEAIATGFVINGPGILDPCEKEAQDALIGLTKQEREDITVSAQLFLRYIAFRQIYKVLGMEQLPALKFPIRPWRINRKRRRSSGRNPAGGDGAAGGEGSAAAGGPGGDEGPSDTKIVKKEAAGSSGAAAAAAGGAAAGGAVAAAAPNGAPASSAGAV